VRGGPRRHQHGRPGEAKREAGDQGLLGLRGHRATGGIRASLYNGMPPQGAAVLAEFMRDFEKRA